MFYLNKVQIIGRATADAKFKQLPNSDNRVASFRIVSNKRIKKKNAPKDAKGKEAYTEKATFVDVEVWQQRADYASQYVKRGTPVFVEGELETDEWGPEGERRSKLKIYGSKIQVEYPKKEEESSSSTNSNVKEEVNSHSGSDLPF